MPSSSRYSSKQLQEQEAFGRFAKSLGTLAPWHKVESRPEPEPDLVCEDESGCRVAFELVSLVDEGLAKVIAAGSKARQDAFSTSDPSATIIRNKLNKKYITNAKSIELLIYTDGRIVTPDDAIIATILPWFDAVAQNPFKRVWFMGERVTVCLWNSA